LLLTVRLVVIVTSNSKLPNRKPLSFQMYFSISDDSQAFSKGTPTQFDEIVPFPRYFALMFNDFERTLVPIS
jgi:hypothetical protein